MINKLKPYLWIAKLVLVVAACAATWAACSWKYGRDIAEIQRDYSKAQADALDAARERDRALTSENEKLQKDLRNEKANAKKLAAARDDDIDSGRLRLSVAARGSGERTTAESGQARAELEPAFAKSLFAITDEGDAAIRDLNYCIDAYEAVRVGDM